MNIKCRYIKLSIILIAIIILFSFSVQAKKITLVIEGQKTAAKLMVANGRTLIPARFISEYFGEDLIWDQEKKKLKFTNRDLKVMLTVDKKIAFVNSQAVPLEVRPKLINGQLMIPLRFLPKIYGGELTWNASNKTIDYNPNQVNDISVANFSNKSKVTIKTDYLTEYDVKLYHQPKRLVINLEGVNLGEVKNSIPVNTNVIKRVRTSQFQVAPAMVRIVVDINQLSSYQIKEKDSKLVLRVTNNKQVVTSSLTSNYQKSKTTANSSSSYIRKKIVIDPGHGGNDSGAVGVSGVEEKSVNYQIAKRVITLLKKENFKVRQTRKSNQFLSLSRRAQLANNWSADVFISIHANFNNKSWVNGAATYAHWHASKDNWALAWYVQSEMINRIKIKDNGLKTANFAVLRKTYMPAILIETAFLSNPREEHLLTTANFQQKVAEGIVAGIKKYFANKSKRL